MSHSSQFLRKTSGIRDADARIRERLRQSPEYAVTLAAILDLEDAKLQSAEAMGDPASGRYTHVLRSVYDSVAEVLQS